MACVVVDGDIFIAIARLLCVYAYVYVHVYVVFVFFHLSIRIYIDECIHMYDIKDYHNRGAFALIT